MTDKQAKEAETVEEPQTELAVEEVEAAEELAHGEEIDELTLLRQELEEAKAKEAEYLDGWQRARAELANARKRFQRDQEQSYSNARADVVTRLLSIADDFERAIEMLPDNAPDLGWTEGVLLVQRKLQQFLEQDGVTPIEAVGLEFDPMLHQAVTHEPSEEVPPGHVIAELQKGYKMGDLVLRPSVVRVSSGPLPEAEPQAAAEEHVEEEPTSDEQTEA